jgi:hypothetical protein
MNSAGRQFGDDIGRTTVRDLDDIEAQLLGRSPRPVGVRFREPTGVRLTIVVNAKHDDFRRSIGFRSSGYLLGHDVLLESKGARWAPRVD